MHTHTHTHTRNTHTRRPAVTEDLGAASAGVLFNLLLVSYPCSLKAPHLCTAAGLCSSFSAPSNLNSPRVPPSLPATQPHTLGARTPYLPSLPPQRACPCHAPRLPPTPPQLPPAHRCLPSLPQRALLWGLWCAKRSCGCARSVGRAAASAAALAAAAPELVLVMHLHSPPPTLTHLYLSPPLSPPHRACASWVRVT